MKMLPLILLTIFYSAAAGDITDFSGTWETTYGTLFLRQDGSSVSGHYTLGGYSTIEGEVGADGRLVFAYTEQSVSGIGWFDLSDDSMFITGKWRPHGTRQWFDWEGFRAGSGAASSNWLVILESEWQVSMTDEEYSFGEMLASWFARVPGVSVRHRFIHDADDLSAFCLESSGLPGNLYLVIASHGTSAGIELSSGTVSPGEFSNVLEPCRNLALIHFSCCEIMAGRTPDVIVSSRRNWPEGFLVSGYTQSVDWGASGIIEIYYLNQILENGLAPVDAANSVIEDIDFAGESSTRWMEKAGFTWVIP